MSSLYYFIAMLSFAVITIISIAFRINFLFHIALSLLVFAGLGILHLNQNITISGLFAFIIILGIMFFFSIGDVSKHISSNIVDIKNIVNFLTKLKIRYTFSINNIYICIITIFVATLINAYINSRLENNKFELKTLLICIIFYFALAVISKFAFNNNINIINYNFKTDKLQNDHKIKIVHISDTHNQLYPNNELAISIKNANPDFIFISGDIFDELSDFNGTMILLNEIKNIAPIYYSTGNHEYATSDFKEKLAKIKELGIIHLDDDFEILNVNNTEFLIAGLNDSTNSRITHDYTKLPERLLQLEQKIPNEPYLKILLSHRPQLVDTYSASDFDFILSGHAHGGQMRIPYVLNGLYAPNQGFFPKYAGGIYNITEKTTLVINRGLKTWGVPRIFNPPEMLVITFSAK